MQRLAAIEISYRTAATAVRERFAMDVAQKARLEAALRAAFGECVIIKTCGRVEVYVADAPNAGVLVTAFAESLELPVENVAEFAKTYAGHEVVTHLLRVASGLESPILGEDHILGQVRGAFLAAGEHETCGARLSSIFRAAIHTGRHVRRMTGINRIAGSYAEQAVEYVGRKNPARSPRVLIIGTGMLGVEVATALRAAGWESVFIAGRHATRLEDVAGCVGATPIAWEARGDAANRADVVIACTSSPLPILTREMMADDGRPRLLIDLGMPRNIEPSIAGLRGVTIATLDDVLIRGDASGAIVQQAERIIDIESHRVARWFAARRHVETIRLLRAWAERSAKGGRPCRRHAAHLAIMQLQSGSKEAAA